MIVGVSLMLPRLAFASVTHFLLLDYVEGKQKISTTSVTVSEVKEVKVSEVSEVKEVKTLGFNGHCPLPACTSSVATELGSKMLLLDVSYMQSKLDSFSERN